MEYDQMFIFQYNPSCDSHTSSIGVAVLLDPIDQKVMNSKCDVSL